MSAMSAIKTNIPWVWTPAYWQGRLVGNGGHFLKGMTLAVKTAQNFFKNPPPQSKAHQLLALSPGPASAPLPKIDFHKFFFPMSLLSISTFTPVTLSNYLIPLDILRTIIGFLSNPKDVLSLSRTCKALVGIRTDAQVLPILWKNHRNDLENVVFGKLAWNTHFGDVGEVDPIPEALIKALEQPCPFIAGKKVKETHIACWIPEKVSGIELTLNTLGELVKKPLRGHASKCVYIWDQVVTDHGATPVKKGHWVLLTKAFIKGSHNKSYDEQKKIVESYPGYEVPTLLPTAIALFMHHARTGERLYSHNLWTYTRCQEKSRGWFLLLGGFAAGGLRFGCDHGDFDIGVGGMQKF